MPTRNSEAIFYVDRPIEFEVDEEGHVLLALASGRWTATLMLTETNFFASCAKAGIIASELRAKSRRGKLVSIAKPRKAG